jgi:hypothetical protein
MGVSLLARNEQIGEPFDRSQIEVFPWPTIESPHPIKKRRRVPRNSRFSGE